MWKFLIIVVCFGFNGLIAASEFAFVAISRPRLKRLAAQGEKAAERVLAMRENPEKVLSVLQLGQTFISIIAAAVGGVGVENALSPWIAERFDLSQGLSQFLAILLFVLPYTFITVVLSELMPKSIALHSPKWVIFNVDRWIVFLTKILAPIIFLLEKSTKWSAKIFFSWLQKEEVETEDLILAGKHVRPYMVNLAQIEEKKLKDIMIPWNEVDTIDKSATAEEVKEIVLKTGHTRIPVIENQMPVGLLNTKKFFVFLEKEPEDWQKLIRPLIRFDQNDPPFKSLRKMQSERSHLCIIFAEERPIGIVTIEDILEEVVGEIYDEDDINRAG